MNPTPIPAKGMKTTMAHTPGNWHKDGPCVYSNFYNPDTGFSLVRVADFTPAEDDEHLIPERQEEANAALCALAPAMKDALQAMLPWMDKAIADNAFAGCVLPLAPSKIADQARNILSTLNQTKAP